MMGLPKLKELTVKIGSGQTPRGGYRAYVPSGVPLIRSQNVLMGTFSEQGLAFIADKTDSEMAGSRVEPGDVLLNITGASIGRVCVVPAKICPANVNQHVCIIRCGESLRPEFLAGILASPRFQKLIADQEAGGTRQALTKAMIENFEIPLPDKEVQAEISLRLGKRLGEVDKAKSAALSQLRELDALTNSIIFDSVKKPGSQLRLGAVLDEVKQGIGEDWASHPVLGATRDGMAPAKESPGKQAHKYKPAVPGTVFYNPMRILIGSIAMVDEDDTPGITSPDYVVLRGKPGEVDSRWFYYWLRSPLGANCIQSLTRGAVRERMLFNRLAEGEIALPSFTDQQRASAALKELKPLKRALEARLAEINLLPEKILSAAFEM